VLLYRAVRDYLSRHRTTDVAAIYVKTFILRNLKASRGKWCGIPHIAGVHMFFKRQYEHIVWVTQNFHTLVIF
jgi:hypothetical protein